MRENGGVSTSVETDPDPALTTAFRASRAICQQHAKSFYFASFFLPKRKRDASYAVYAFCRMIDDAIDQDDASIQDSGQTGCCGGSALDTRLNLFRDRLDEIYSNRLELPNPDFRSPTQQVLFAFSRTVERYEIPKDFFLDLAQ